MILLLGVLLYFKRCNGSSFDVDDVAKRHEFTVKPTNFTTTIDAPAVIHVKGHLDGRAVVFIPNGTQDSSGLPIGNEFYTLKLPPGAVDKQMTCEMIPRDFPLIYQPITANKGSLVIDVNF
ncbi:hypothetical protein [Fibrisoma limi]|uniref:hypothetical protein n=1 Tax=Fibrisoma limi TaxID=663275 RepID=UPI001788D600|nr:hypothetical protein [Fibrisoma limi]